jgi:hypothetical protein
MLQRSIYLRKLYETEIIYLRKLKMTKAIYPQKLHLTKTIYLREWLLSFTWESGMWERQFNRGNDLHCKDKIPKFLNKYSQKKNIGVSVPISTFMRLWVIYISPQSVCLFCWRQYVDRSWAYINRSQTHECGNWGWGRAIPRKGIHKWDFRCSVGQGHLPEEMTGDKDDDDADEDDGQVQFTRVGIAATRMREP